LIDPNVAVYASGYLVDYADALVEIDDDYSAAMAG